MRNLVLRCMTASAVSCVLCLPPDCSASGDCARSPSTSERCPQPPVQGFLIMPHFHVPRSMKAIVNPWYNSKSPGSKKGDASSAMANLSISSQASLNPTSLGTANAISSAYRVCLIFARTLCAHLLGLGAQGPEPSNMPLPPGLVASPPLSVHFVIGLSDSLFRALFLPSRLARAAATTQGSRSRPPRPAQWWCRASCGPRSAGTRRCASATSSQRSTGRASATQTRLFGSWRGPSTPPLRCTPSRV